MGLKIVLQETVPEENARMTLRLRGILAVPGALLLLSLAGCSFSASSASISDIVSSPFTSSSDSLSSSSGDRAQGYEADVRDYSEAYVRSSSDIGGFRKGLGSIAQKHGVTDWEADTTTYRGIGEGLAKAQATQMQVEVYKTNLAPGDPMKAAAIQNGYDQGKR